MSAHTNYCIVLLYYMARACKYITRFVIGQYSGPDFPVMPTGIMSDVNARLARVSVKPGTPRDTPEHPRNIPGTPLEHPGTPRNNPGTPLEHPIIPRDTLGTARNTPEHQKWWSAVRLLTN